MIGADAALERLVAGNRRFVAGDNQAVRRPTGNAPQEPFAIVLGCSDSRVPAEIVFDVGLGGLFVIRVAGNVVAPSQIGSVEFAAEQFGTRLVVVLGHTHCGAVRATLDELERPSENRTPLLRSIVGRIRPAVEPLMTGSEDDASLMAAAVRANVHASVNHIVQGSEILESLVQQDGLVVRGAEYSIETGEVVFL